MKKISPSFTIEIRPVMYYVVFGIFYCLSLLPFAVLYLFSDLLYLLTYYIVGYRKEIVINNLRSAFPEKQDSEIKSITKDFYKAFCDNWIESVKLISVSGKAICSRVTGNLSAFDEVYSSGRSCYALLGHWFNWEWGNTAVQLRGPYHLLASYAPLSNKIFDRLFLYIRKRFGTALLPFNDMRRAMLPFRNKQVLLALMADQSPPGPEKSYWLEFFNQLTPVMKGPERGARLGKMPVIFVGASRPRRGHYHLEAILLTDNAAELKEGELTMLYMNALEASITNSPSLYLWSHNRWKHKWKDEYASNLLEQNL